MSQCVVMIFNKIHIIICTGDRNTVKIEKMEDIKDIFIDTLSSVTHKSSQERNKFIMEVYNGTFYIFTPFGTH